MLLPFSMAIVPIRIRMNIFHGHRANPNPDEHSLMAIMPIRIRMNINMATMPIGCPQIA